jgi:hypothetical protein
MACKANPLSQPIMASGKVPVFFLTYYPGVPNTMLYVIFSLYSQLSYRGP